ncbi:hypothetical protein [Streptomyces cadmiisoli]|uniref:hypothetical protein n=1 Tax=Streptomyces cadmiisoli TaxID=2184053 RepID=UPI00364BC534
MPVEPIPCDDGGTGTPVEVTTCCSPSIASTPLCRDDGTSVLLVVRSGCVECGATAEDPAVVGWIAPTTGAFTAGPAPADAAPCSQGCSCSPSIATSPLCRADGTTLLLVVRNDCADCDTPAPDPEVIGWLDPLTGTFTPGAAPADAGPCEPGCVDTICRQLCDDADGDGAADTTYSELWCIRADGSAQLVLTYRDDPSTPYTPLAPVECTYGCPESETVTLCDASGPFLRRYSFLQGTASYEDVALDGQTPHVVTGTVGVCTGDDTGGTLCAAQTTPAATLGLCLADGTPIAVVVTRDCDGLVSQDGWLNLTTGAWSAGEPPAGTVACGDSRSIQVSGTFCDVLPDGTVAGLVLVEYTYDDAGAVASVRLVDATTGTTYVPQGEVTTCPTGEALPERDLVQLCDTAGSGDVTVFVRDYARNDTGAITGHTDYLLDGTAYTPLGTVGVCSGAPDEQCVPLALGEVCYAPALTEATMDLGTANDATWWEASTPAAVADPSTLTYVQDATSYAYPISPGPVTGQLRTPLQTSLNGSGTGYAYLRREFTTSVPITAVTLSAQADDRPLRIWLDGLLVGDFSSDPVHYFGIWSPVVTTAVSLPAGDHTLYYEWFNTVPVAEWGALDVRLTLADDGVSARAQVVRNCDGTTMLVDIETGQTVPDTATIVTCPCSCSTDGGSGTCSNSTALLLCDLPDDVDPSGEPVAADTGQQFIADLPNADFVARAGGGAALWSGGTIAFGPDAATGPGITQVHRYVAATLQADAPACNAGTARLTLSVQVENLGPGTGCSGAGRFRLFHTDGSVLASGQGLLNTPVGTPETLVIEADVPAADLAAGDVAVWLDVETYQTGLCAPPDTKQWQASNFTASYAYDVDGCGEQFLRTVVTDCDTGAVTATSDATLDGAPYTVTGTVGQCTGAGCGGGTVTTGTDVEVLALCDTDGSGAVTVFLRQIAYAAAGTVDTVTDTALDGTTPYTPTGTVGTCTAAVEPGVDVELLPMCVIDNASGGIIQRILAEIRYDTETGARLAVNYVDPVTWGPVALPGGTHLDVCPPDTPEECTAQSVIEACRCDDTDGDGIADTDYVELLAVDCEGTLTSLGTYTADLSAPYTPVAPIDCDETDEGADPARGVQARRLELAAGESWAAAVWPTLQSVTAVAHGGTGTVTTQDGPSTLHTGEAATWSVARDVDAALTGPLTIAADTGTVTVTWTQGVTL